MASKYLLGTLLIACRLPQLAEDTTNDADEEEEGEKGTRSRTGGMLVVCGAEAERDDAAEFMFCGCAMLVIHMLPICSLRRSSLGFPCHWRSVEVLRFVAEVEV